MKKGDLVKFIDCSDEQVKWGNNDDPRQFLASGGKYQVYKVEVHSWHTKVVLYGFLDNKFNSVHFEIIDLINH